MPGTRFGPQAILEASRQVEFYDEELDLEPYRIGIATLGAIEVDPLGPEAALDRLEAVTLGLADQGVIPFTLGGEHSLTIAPVRALRQLWWMPGNFKTEAVVLRSIRYGEADRKSVV